MCALLTTPVPSLIVSMVPSIPQACAGMRLLSMWKASIVPINEMAGVLTVRHKASDLDVGSWVRIKMGVYKGDLAQVGFGACGVDWH